MGIHRAASPRFILPLALFVLLLAGCASVEKPDGWAPAVKTDDTLYASLNGGKISALDPDDFTERWEFPADNEFACGQGESKDRNLDGIYAAPAIGDELIYIGAYDGNAYAVNKESGACTWVFETEDPIIGGVVLGDAGLYVPSSDGHLYLVDPESGALIKSFEAGDIWGTPLLSEGAVYVTTMDGQIWKLDPEALEPIWDSPFEAPAALLTSPSGDEGPATIVAGGIGNSLYGVDAETSDEVWSFEGGNWFWGQPLVNESSVYATNLGGKVYAVDLESGDELWSFDTGEKIRATAAWMDDAVIVVNEVGDVYSLDPETGQPNWGPTEIGEKVFADPAVIDGEVFIVTRNGDVITIDDAGLPKTVVDG